MGARVGSGALFRRGGVLPGACDEVVDGAVDVAVVAHHEGARGERDREGGDASQELRERLAAVGECLGSAVDDDELFVFFGGDAATEEAAVVGFVVDDVLESARDVCAVGVSCVEERAIGEIRKTKSGSRWVNSFRARRRPEKRAARNGKIRAASSR